MDTQGRLEELKNFAPHSLWFFEILLGILGLFLLHVAIKYVVRRIRQRAISHKQDWRQNLDAIVMLPVKILLIAVGIYYTISILGNQFSLAAFTSALKPFQSSVVVLCLAWICLRWKKEVLHSTQKHLNVASPSMIHAFSKVISILICVLALLIILQIFELDIVPLLAFGGIGAAAMAFAAKDVIGNFFGGLMLSITRPFIVGDIIVLPDQNNLEGQVEEVGWYLTFIRDKEKRAVYLPNAIFSNILVINNSRMSHRRIYETLGVRYTDVDKLKKVTEEMREIITAHPAIDSHIKPLIYLNAFKDSFVAIYLDVYTLTTRWEDFLAVKEEILFKVFEIFEREGVKMPYPTITLDLPAGMKS